MAIQPLDLREVLVSLQLCRTASFVQVSGFHFVDSCTGVRHQRRQMPTRPRARAHPSRAQLRAKSEFVTC